MRRERAADKIKKTEQEGKGKTPGTLDAGGHDSSRKTSRKVPMYFAFCGEARDGVEWLGPSTRCLRLFVVATTRQEKMQNETSHV